MAQRLIDATGGNPLALIELPDVLTEAQLDGREALSEPLPVGPQIEGGFPAPDRRAVQPRHSMR